MVSGKHARFANSRAAARLRGAIRGEALFGAIACAPYATDASLYQILPLGVIAPRDGEDLRAVVDIALEEGLALTARGAGTGVTGQAVSEALIIDFSHFCNRILSLDADARRCLVEPGVTLAALNAALRPQGLWFPVECPVPGLATLGGMAGVNASGLRGLRHGGMRDNVAAIDALLADGRAIRFTDLPPDLDAASLPEQAGDLIFDLLEIGERHEARIRSLHAPLARTSGGFGLDALAPSPQGQNLARLLVGSEGTLALTRTLELKLAPLPGPRALGVCPFPSLDLALRAVPPIVAMNPAAVELVSRHLLDSGALAAGMTPAARRLLRGDPDALLFVEFDDENQVENTRRLSDLNGVMAGMGLGRGWTVIESVGSSAQQTLWDVRQLAFERLALTRRRERALAASLGQCAVPIDRLADYAAHIQSALADRGVEAVWHGHAGAGGLHLRPALELNDDGALKRLRALAEDVAMATTSVGGLFAGGEGLGLARSEFLDTVHDRETRDIISEVKALFDPEGRLNPGKIIAPPPMDETPLLALSPWGEGWVRGSSVPSQRAPQPPSAAKTGAACDPTAPHPTLSPEGRGLETVETSALLSHSPGEAPSEDKDGEAPSVSGAAGLLDPSGLLDLSWRCDRSGLCRKREGGVMCPSFRLTGAERDSPRGRAAAFRLALSGELGSPDEALASDEMAAILELCLACKACRSECPNAMDIGAMKLVALSARAARHGLSRFDRTWARLPGLLPRARRWRRLLNLRDSAAFLARLSERWLGFSADRPWPRVGPAPFAGASPSGPEDGREVLLFPDTFNLHFDSDALRAAVDVLAASGCRVHLLTPPPGERPYCCGRTFLEAGLVEDARREAARLIAAVGPFLSRGATLVGIEPSCLFTLRDEIRTLLPTPEAQAVAENTFLFETFAAAEQKAGRFSPPLRPIEARAVLHGHCWQKASGAMADVKTTLALVPGLEVEEIEAGCCGMAGGFGYRPETLQASLAVGEQALFPALRNAPDDALIVAGGFFCRQQIITGAGRAARHPAVILKLALVDPASP